MMRTCAGLALAVLLAAAPSAGQERSRFDLRLRPDPEIGYRFRAESLATTSVGRARSTARSEVEFGLTVFLSRRSATEVTLGVRFDRVSGSSTGAAGDVERFARAAGAAHDGRPETAPVGEQVLLTLSDGALRVDGLERAFRRAGKDAAWLVPRTEQVLRSIVGSRPRKLHPKATTWRHETQLPTEDRPFVASTYYRVEEVADGAVVLQFAGSARPRGEPEPARGSPTRRALLKGTARVSVRDGLPLERRSSFVRTVGEQPPKTRPRRTSTHTIEIVRLPDGERPPSGNRR